MKLGRVVRRRIGTARDPVVNSHKADATLAGDLATGDPASLTNPLNLIGLQDEHRNPFFVVPSLVPEYTRRTQEVK